MKSKVIVLLGSLLIVSTTISNAQHSDTSNIKLPIFQVDACLYNLLKTVSESNIKYYKADEFFYSVIFKEGKEYRYLNIVPEKWADSRYMDYAGIMKFNKVSFLFRGDIEKDSIFKRTALPGLEVPLKKSTVDPESNVFYQEPSLHGIYHICTGMPIYMEIYTKGEIGDYKMKIPKGKRRKH
jgi:hypothetical protein